MSNPLLNPAEIKSDITNSTKRMSHGSEALNGLVKIEEELKAMKSKNITFSSAILTLTDDPIIFPNTINTIQGQTGAHKSRFAEVICSALLKGENCESKLLGFHRHEFDANSYVVYVDTERNLKDQFPSALQRIVMGAGYNKEYDPTTFRYTSLLKVERGERFKALNEYLEKLRESTKAHVFVVLDVTSDCVEDFNRVDRSMELIDMMVRSINEYNVTFLCVLHENPGSEKMRGHLGTELANKSSTVIQVAFEKNSNNHESHVLKVTFKKCRTTKRPDPFHIKYSELGKGLVLADDIDINTLIHSRQEKAPIEEMKEALRDLLGNQQRVQRVVLLPQLIQRTSASKKTIEDRLKGLYETSAIIKDTKGRACILGKEREGRSIVYFLIPQPESEPKSE